MLNSVCLVGRLTKNPELRYTPILLAKQRKKVSDVYKATGISKTTLTSLYYERTKNPEVETLLKIADYLGVTIDELLTPEE